MTGSPGAAERESATSSEPDPGAGDLDAQAIDWIVRLHSGRATAADRRAFAAWRRRSPDHERAGSAAERLWARVGEAGRPLLAETGVGTGSRRAAASSTRAWPPRPPPALAWRCCPAIPARPTPPRPAS